ncbi:MAG: alpha-E domain-containing protein [Ruminococcus sp.]
MGIITLENMDRLVWLGRYTERVNSTIKVYFDGMDRFVDGDKEFYKDICKRIDIPDIYKDADDFLSAYPYDENNFNSIICNLTRAYDNAIVMRDYIDTETLAYIQLAIYDIQRAKTGKSSVRDLYSVIDHIMGFWGCVDDRIDDYLIRAALKAGKRIERVYLYLCFERAPGVILREITKMEKRMGQIGMKYNTVVLDTLKTMLENPEFDYSIGKLLFFKLFEE